MNYLLHIGNILYLVGFSVRDILWLRIITVIATAFLIPFYCVQSTPLYEPMFWGVLFMVINIVQIAILLLERRPVFLGEEELHLYRTLFSSLRPREFVKLLSIAEWKQAPAGGVLLEQNKPVDALLLIASGQGKVEMDGRRVAELGPGQFVGEMGFLTEQVAIAQVSAAVTTDYLLWPAAKLRELLSASPALHVKVQGVLGNDVVSKLRLEAEYTAHPSVLFEALGEVKPD